MPFNQRFTQCFISATSSIYQTNGPWIIRGCSSFLDSNHLAYPQQKFTLKRDFPGSVARWQLQDEPLTRPLRPSSDCKPLESKLVWLRNTLGSSLSWWWWINYPGHYHPSVARVPSAVASHFSPQHIPSNHCILQTHSRSWGHQCGCPEVAFVFSCQASPNCSRMRCRLVDVRLNEVFTFGPDLSSQYNSP